MKYYNRIMEIFWLVTGISLVVLSVYLTIKQGVEPTWPFYFLPIACLLVYLLRRGFRKSAENKIKS